MKQTRVAAGKGEPDSGSGELRACARAFVTELIRLQDELSQGRSDTLGEPAEDAVGGDAGLATDSTWVRVQADQVHRRLSALLDRHGDAQRRRGSGLYFAEADYALSALADELLLHEIDWAGADLWREHLLERARFGTEAAGDRLFERIDALRGQPDAAYGELASVYLLVLGLGFQGRYRHVDAPVAPDDGAPAAQQDDPIALRRRELFRIACLADPSLADPGRPLVTQAPALTEGVPGRLPGLRRWAAVLAVVVVVWLLVGQVIWSVATQPVRAQLQDWANFQTAQQSAASDRP